MKQHLANIFDVKTKIGETNRKVLFRDKYLKTHMPLDFGEKTYYVCFGCHHFFSHSHKADDHFSKNKAKCLTSHQQNIEVLRQDYPKQEGDSGTSGFSPTDIKVIQEAVWNLYEWMDDSARIRHLLEQRYEDNKDALIHKRLETHSYTKPLFKKLPIDLKYETLKKLFEPEEEEEQPEPEPEPEPEQEPEPEEQEALTLNPDIAFAIDVLSKQKNDSFAEERLKILTQPPPPKPTPTLIAPLPLIPQAQNTIHMPKIISDTRAVTKPRFSFSQS